MNGWVAGVPDRRTIARGMFLALAILLTISADAQATVDVRYTEGLVRGFLVLRAMDGTVLADGDLAHEIVTFSQRGSFQLLNYRLVEKGPVFEVPMDMSIDRSTGEVLVRYTDKEGEEKVESDRLDLPPDLANGMIPVLLKNIPRDAKQTTVSLLAATPKPRLVTLAITPEGEAKFLAGGDIHKATQYRLEVEIGGIVGLLARLVGKQPQDSHAWVLDGDAPGFVRMEGPLFMDGPSWRIEPVSPVWQGQ